MRYNELLYKNVNILEGVSEGSNGVVGLLVFAL